MVVFWWWCGGDKGETKREHEQPTTRRCRCVSGVKKNAKGKDSITISKTLNTPHTFFLWARTPKSSLRNSKNPTQKTSIRAAFRTSLALAFVMGFANVWGSHPKDNAKGGRAWYAVVLALDSDFFFRVKCDASHLVYFFLAAVKGFRAMEKRRGKRDGREGVGVDRDAEVRDAECFRLDFLFVSSRGRRGWEMEPISARIFFLPFLSSFGWTSKR